MSSMKPMLDCDAVMRQLWDYLDGELTSERVAAIREHLALCARCYPQLEFERTFLDTLARVRREHSNPERVRERVLTALRAEGFATA
ncbi:MAG TPA: zf-HC2 domain-containing protein [Gemmatimonadaceae bacterium]|nr:zf-HC2 domain-containing protein [Gemmatimonadaceae bacterium]